MAASKEVLFSAESQLEFSTASGDWNPIHSDSVAARRTTASRCVVHGMNIVLTGLELIAGSRPRLPFPRQLRVRFLKPIYVGENVFFSWSEDDRGEIQIAAHVAELKVAEIQLSPGEGNAVPEELLQFSCEGAMACRELPLAEMAGRVGTVAPAIAAKKLQTMFPHAARWLGVSRVAGLLCLSRLVGMECPGLHSLFAGFQIEFCRADVASLLAYKVENLEPRIRRLTITVHGLGLRGKIDAFARQPPAPQPSISQIAGVVRSDEFAQQRVLVVGGSRGLGELTAKIIAAGGGHPILTYSVGKDDAERVAEEIRNWGGQCEPLKYDVSSPAAEQLAALDSPVSYAYYFASGPIFRRRTKQFDPRLLDEFLGFYVHGFFDLCTALRTSSPAGASLFYPSSIAVEERPPDITEYAMAKAAGEILCADLNRSWPGIRIKAVRLPRLATDQTSSILPVKTEDSLDVLLPIIREVQSVRF